MKTAEQRDLADGAPRPAEGEADAVNQAHPPDLGGARGATLARNAAIVALFLALYALFLPRMVGALDPLTGDEPFYVMTALSILRDGDIEESNNYARRDYESFYPPNPLPAGWRGWPAFPRTLPPHPAHSVRPGLYSKHGLGVALLILGPYALGGRVAAVLALNLVAALVALNMVLLARRYLSSPEGAPSSSPPRFGGAGGAAAIALALPFALANPLMSYAYLIFPEVFAALAIVYAFRRSREDRNTALQWAGVGLALAILPWLHARFAPAVLGLGLILLPGLRRERDRRRRLALVIPPAVSAVALVSYYLYIYGRPLPDPADHAGFNDPAGTVNAFFGLFLDEQWGLLIYTPIYLLAGIGFATFWARRRADAAALLAVVAPYLLLVALYRVWWGEWGPAARYLAPVAPLAIAPLACWAASIRRPLAVAAVALFALPGFAAMAGFLAAPQLLYNHPTGHSALFTAWAARLGERWPKVIPSFQPYAPSPAHLRAGWSLLLAWLVTAPFILRLLPPASPPSPRDGRPKPAREGRRGP